VHIPVKENGWQECRHNAAEADDSSGPGKPVVIRITCSGLTSHSHQLFFKEDAGWGGG